MSADLLGNSSDPKVKAYLRNQEWLTSRTVLLEIYNDGNAQAIADACGLHPSHLSTAINAPFTERKGKPKNDRHLNDLHILAILSFATHDQFRRYYNALLSARGLEATEEHPPTLQELMAKVVFALATRGGETGMAIIRDLRLAP